MHQRLPRMMAVVPKEQKLQELRHLLRLDALYLTSDETEAVAEINDCCLIPLPVLDVKTRRAV